jgi:hypothetical protein
MSRVTRRLGIKITPSSPGKFAINFDDGTTKSDDGKRVTGAVLTVDTFELDGVPQALSLKFRDFARSLENEDQGELFADKKTAKPKLDQA